MRNNVDCAVVRCSAAQMPGFQPAAREYINIYILFTMSTLMRL